MDLRRLIACYLSPKEPPVDRISTLPPKEPPVDRISALPDHLLHHILSFLPTELAIQTRLLSSRWRDLLDFARLELRYHDPTAALGSFRLFIRRRYDDLEASDVEALVARAADHAIHELYLKLVEVRRLTLPPSIFSLASLRVLNLCSGSVWPPSASLPSLVILNLSNVRFAEDTPRDFVARSCPRLKICRMSWCSGLSELEMNGPLLEALELKYWIGVQWIRVAGERLKRLDMTAFLSGLPPKVILISTPNLETFQWVNQPPLHIFMQRFMASLSSICIDLWYHSVNRCHKPWNSAGAAALILGALESRGLDITSLTLLGEGVLKGHIECPAVLGYSGLQYLDLRVDRFDMLDVLGIAFLLKCAPNLNRLTIYSKGFYNEHENDRFRSDFIARGGFGRGGFWESQDLFLEQLSCVRLYGARGTPYEIDFIQFLLRTVTALKEITIINSLWSRPVEWQWLKLWRTPWASSSVKLSIP